MAFLQAFLDKLKQLYQQNPKLSKIILAAIIFYILNKLYSKWKYKQQLFTSQKEKSRNAIFITGCDTGFGYAMATKLSINLGYPVIATCLQQESVDAFMNNKQFTATNSISTRLDVTSKQQIEECKEFIINYLNKNNIRLWGIVNNAGISIIGEFELVPYEFDKLQRDILFNGPLNIIRELLPILPGRANYVQNDKLLGIRSDGGRIVNISSCTAHMLFDTRYGVSKGAMTYFSHSLRMELSPRFGIWCVPIEPAAFGTSLFKNINVWTQRLYKNLTENNKSELMDVYEFDEEKITEFVNVVDDNHLSPKIYKVVDAVVHGLTAKYPLRVYHPGWTIPIKLISISSWWVKEKFSAIALFIYN